MAMASSSTSSNTFDLKKYDVFISFRGDDTRAGFTSHLHAALKRIYLETYIDYRIEKGNQVWAELVEAIKGSTLFLVVFSENYASSTWCLNELVEIVECHKNGQVVIPVFYQIDPSHVRKQTGSYGTAMAKHKKQGNNDDKMMQIWKNALSQAANLSGFDSISYRTESDLIEDITKVVLQKLNHNYTSELACNFILDDNYWSIQPLIEKNDSSKVQIIGLWGMGGIGKTTLAAAIFHKVSFQYDGSCFLDNVNEIAKIHGINYTCNKLLSKLLREDLHIDNSKVIPSIIIRRLKRMKSFIVLDDVHTLEFLQNLIGVGCGWLGAGSTVIVTTRDKQVLISGGIQKIHEVKKMNSRNSLQLFSLNAFGKTLPKEGFVELSDRAVDYADGNPLALKVLGSFLRCKSEIEWKCALAKLEEIPNAEIDRILRWSYNELDDKEKNIFLDIACFFKGHEREKITKTLNECGFFADIGIRLLLDKALIRLDFRNCIQMHDLIQEMGKQIVREECLKNPEQRSRLFDPKEVCGVLKNNRGTEIVEAIFLVANQCTNINLSPKAFEKMVNLRLLAIHDPKGYVSLPHGLDLLPENLRYVLWDGYPWKSLPPTFRPDMLVELSLRESHVQKLWNGVLNLPNLEILDLSRSKKLIECPNVSGFPNLKEVILGDCDSLHEVDSSIFLLQKLTRIFMAGCTSLKSLSSTTCSPALTELNAVGCINLQEFSVTFSSVDNLFLALSKFGGNELPSSILQTKNLNLFIFPMIGYLVNLPENFAKNIFLMSSVNRDNVDPSIILHKLLSSPSFMTVTHLNLTNISLLFEIPDNIFLLSSLETLTLIGLAIRSLPETIKYLPRLAEFGVYDCKLLQSIPAFSHFIKSLVVWNCESLEKLSSSMGEPHEKTNPGFTMLLNCNQLDLHSYRAVLKDALGGIDLRARLSSQYEIMYLFNEYFLPDMPGREFWFHYRSTQVSFTLELPSNLFGFAYYLVISQGRVENGAYFRCECYVDNSVTITSFTRVKIIEHQYWTNLDNSIHMMSDHLVLWYDPVSCKQIMDEIKAIKDVNNSGYNPKLTFRFFIDQSETLYDEVSIKECGFRWIYQENIVPHTIFESDDEEEEEEIIPIFESSDEEKEEEEIVPRTIFESHEEKEDEEETIRPKKKLCCRFFHKKNNHFL
ncbi:TMV resistance protein N-like [Trifolium pratense]|uniref:TMV resistance protein N-like n=1 Tax=Trifolium pratense TaxID=57577 RepID=UPI001E6969EB|nr:TMV resistance protein N-like [Trifolium pratense]